MQTPNPRIGSRFNAARLLLAFAAFGFGIAASDRAIGVMIPITSVEGFPNGRISNDPPANAVDGSVNTYTWTTEAFTKDAPCYLAVGFTGTNVNRIRLWKTRNGGCGENIKNIFIQYTTDTDLPLSSRTWQNVTGLQSGWQGAEFFNAAGVSADGSVTGDVHDSPHGDGWGSLIFDTVNATGIRIGFSNPDFITFNHYQVGEFQVYLELGLPALYLVSASQITDTTATLSGNVVANGFATTAYFDYGQTTNYGTATAVTDVGSGSTPVTVSNVLSGLAAQTFYHFRLVAYSSQGTNYSADQTFRTGPSVAPNATTLAASAVSSVAATVNGTVNPNGYATTAHFEYGLTTDYGTSTPTLDVGNGTSLVSVSNAVSGLSVNTSYHFRLVVMNAGGTNSGGDVIFTTPAASAQLQPLPKCSPNLSPVLAGFDTARSGIYSFASGADFSQARSALFATFPDIILTNVSALTPTEIQTVDILLIGSAAADNGLTVTLTSDEQLALLDYVRKGGSAVIFSDNDRFAASAPDANRSLLEPFGITTAGTITGVATAEVLTPTNHPVTDGRFGIVASLTQNFPGGLTALGTNAVALATNGIGVALAVIDAGVLGPGSGRVVVYSDINMFTDSTLSGLFPDNKSLFLNTIDYCRRSTCQPELSIRASQMDPSNRVSQVQLCWTSQSNAMYQVQFCTSLTTILWTALGEQLVASNATTCIFDAIPGGQPQRYYRVARLR